MNGLMTWKKFLLNRLVRLMIPIAIVAAVSGCGASWHLKRAIAKDPSIIQPRVVQMDTTIVTPERIVHDTIVMNVVDTIEMIRDRVRIQLVRNYDTIAVNVECPSDTIRVIQTASVDNVCPPQPYDWAKWLGWIISILCMAFIVRRLRF